MDNPWDQLPDETAKNFAAFCGYRNLGPDRSLLKAYEIYKDIQPGQRSSKNIPPYFAQMSAKFKWVERAKAWDANLEAIKAEEIETAAALEARRWAERYEKLREQEFEAGQQLIERAQEMLEYPLVRTETKADGQTVIVVPADWKPADVVAFLNTASKLARMAIGTHTDLAATREVEQQEMRIGDKVVKF